MTLPASSGWDASLDLGFEQRKAGTVLVRNRHHGPLLVQKALYPEGQETCHVAVLHPPGGIAASDSLHITASLSDRTRALLTTPGATKWYRSEGAVASQQVQFRLTGDAVLEWFPRESILFDGSDVSTRLDVDLAPSARYLGWEILSFGRRASGECWRRGRLRMRTTIRAGERLLFAEMADVDAAGGFAQSTVGLSACTVCGTLLVAGYDIDDELLRACRGVQPVHEDARYGITRLPAVFIARYLGNSTEDALRWYTDIWSVLRPALTHRAACAPRVWSC